MTSKVRSDGGFTLIEVMLTVVILAIITVPIGNLLIEYLTDTTDVGSRVDASVDAEMAAQYFGQDVAAMGARGTAASLPASLWTSGSPSACGQADGSVVVVIASDDYASVANQTFVATDPPPAVDYTAYVAVGSKAPYELHRVRCIGAGTAQASNITVAHNLAAIPAAPSCDGGTCGVTTPTVVELSISIMDTRRSTTLPVVLHGERRQSS